MENNIFQMISFGHPALDCESICLFVISQVDYLSFYIPSQLIVAL